MTTIEYPRQSFEAMSRKQAITTCYALEDMRDRAVAEVERLRAQLNEATPDDRCEGCSDEHCTATT